MHILNNVVHLGCFQGEKRGVQTRYSRAYWAGKSSQWMEEKPVQHHTAKETRVESGIQLKCIVEGSDNTIAGVRYGHIDHQSINKEERRQ